MLDKSFYNTVLSQTFSACGKYLLAGNSYGQIAIYNLDKVLNPNFDDFTYSNKPEQILTVDKDVQICSMASTEKFLVVGTHSEISGWDWSCLKDKAPKPSWKIALPGGGSILDRVDVNSLWWSEEQELMFAGCGDNNIYAFNLEEGKIVRTFKGHEDYIHSIHGLNSNLISAGEDGLVCIWDSRTQAFNSFEPHSESKLARPDLGKWVGAASLGEDWIICGGGPRLALWQIRSLQPTTVFDLPDRGMHVANFHDDCIIAGGCAPYLYQLGYSGDTLASIPVSATTVYSAVCQSSPHRVFTIAGSSPNIDLCTTFNYADQILSFN